ncbi:MAG: SRPBCC domain-containing protein, partial [Crocinitomicaceae bacterium]|nr:SRPBCC domain-containing protein [Crocinitomicaceae bacterium]
MSEKVKFEMEFEVNSSTSVLFNMISTPSGLSEWFADDVNIKDDLFTFIWDGAVQQAKMIG